MEFLCETYYHSLASQFSLDEFKNQITKHRNKISKLFSTPQVFRNTELILTNEIAQMAEQMGFIGVVGEGADHVLGGRSPNVLYRPQGSDTIKLLTKNYNLSDNIAFRFSDKSWAEWPVNVTKFMDWIDKERGDVINLFMDYETFGEHQWKETGIFNFMDKLPGAILKENSFVTPSEAVTSFKAVDKVDIPLPVSWADEERDLSAWLGNKMQNSAITQLFEVGEEIKATGDSDLIDLWRKMQSSDHFYYMSTKWFNDGDVHNYFNPYDSPYEAFIAFMNILNDIKIRARDAPVLAQ